MRGECFVDPLDHIANHERTIVLFTIGAGAVLSITGDLGGEIGFANAGVTDALDFELVQIFVVQRSLRARKLRDTRFALKALGINDSALAFVAETAAYLSGLEEANPEARRNKALGIVEIFGQSRPCRHHR